MRIRGVICFILFSSSLLIAGMPKQAQEVLKNRYQASKSTPFFSLNPLHNSTDRELKELKTILVVKQPGICAAADDKVDTYMPSTSIVVIENGRIQNETGCHVQLEVGQLVGIKFLNFKNEYVAISCRTIEPVAVTRGIGAFKDKYSENVAAGVLFKFPLDLLESGNTQAIIDAIEQWFTPFDNYAAAKAFSVGMKDNVARKSVREINAGMSIADVENIMGLPDKKANIGNKIIYRYPDMTVEFTNGKVTDVKF